MTATDALAAARAALDAGDHAAALAPLLAAWRAYRAAPLATVIEQVSAIAERAEPRVPGPTQTARTANAHALLRAGRPEDLPRVMRALADAKVVDATALATGLAKVAPDPRFLRELVALLERPPWGVSTGRKIWRILLAALVTHRDPRTAAALTAIAWKPIVRDAWAVEEMEKAIARTVRALDAPAPAANAALDRAIDALAADDAREPPDRGAALLARIYAEPSDLAARAVYGDWLQARGDPRGEMIALQLAHAGGEATEAQRRREATLLAARRDAWLGAIAPAARDRVRFVGGFVDELQIDSVRAVALAGADEWRTVRTLWLDRGTAPMPLLRSPALAALRYVGDVDAGALAPIVRDPEPWRIRGLGVSAGTLSVARTIPLVAALVALPELHELGLASFGRDAAAAWRPLWGSEVARRLVRLRVQLSLARAPDWLAELAHLPSGIETVQLSSFGSWYGWTLELARGRDGRWSRLDARLRPARRGDHEPDKAGDLATALLDELPPDALESLVFRADGARATRAELDAIAGAAARQTRLATLELAGQIVPLDHRRAPAPRAKDVQAAQLATAAAASRAVLARAAEGMRASAALRSLDFTSAASASAVQTALAAQRTRIARGWGDVAFALLELPRESDEAARVRQQAIAAEAIRVLVALQPAGAAKRVIALLESSPHAARWLASELGMVPTDELPALFDWFDARRGKREPRADQLYYEVRNVAAATRSARVRRDLEARLATKKLTSFHRYAYEEAVKLLPRR